MLEDPTILVPWFQILCLLNSQNACLLLYIYSLLSNVDVQTKKLSKVFCSFLFIWDRIQFTFKNCYMCAGVWACVEERGQCWLPCLCTFYLLLLGNVFIEPRLVNSVSLDMHRVPETCMSPSSKYRCYRHITLSHSLHGSWKSELKPQPSTLVTELSL